MLKIWRNFFTGRNKLVLVGLAFMALCHTYDSFTGQHWMLTTPLVVFGWVFFVPAAVYLIDEHNRNKKRREKEIAEIKNIDKRILH